MNVPDRITKVTYVPSLDMLLTADIRGRIHLLDRELNLVRSSPSTHYTNMINAITYDHNYVFTKDIKGVIGKWDIHSLRPLDFHDDYSLRNEQYLQSLEEQSSPSLTRGIGVFNHKLYTMNGYAQLVTLDQDTFEVLDILPPFHENSGVDCICSEHDEIHIISETCGVVHIGNLDHMEFNTRLSVDSGNVHIVRYDKRHQRFIATQDYGLEDDRNVQNGIVAFDMDGSNMLQFPFTNDDVEFLLFNEDYSQVYTGGFDGYVYIFDNSEPELRLEQVLGPFSHQLIGAASVEEDLYLLMQSGEFIKVNIQGETLARADFDYKCVWALEPHPSAPSVLYSASGYSIDVLEYHPAPYNSVSIRTVKSHPHSFGLLFRVCPFPDDSYIALSRDHVVFKCDAEGRIQWMRRVAELPKNIAVNNDFSLALVGLNDGNVLELDAQSGDILHSLKLNAPAYVTGYTDDHLKLIGSKQGIIQLFNSDFEVIKQIELDGYPKRFIKNNGKIYLTGSFGLIELNLEQGSVDKTFIDILWNTKENGVVLQDYAFVISYGKQIGAYEYESGDMVDLVESLYDFPKGMAGSTDGENTILLVGGNGGFVNIYRIIEGSLIKVREYYI